MEVIALRTIQIIAVYTTEQVTDKTSSFWSPCSCRCCLFYCEMARANKCLLFISSRKSDIRPWRVRGLLHTCRTCVSVSLLDEFFPLYLFIFLGNSLGQSFALFLSFCIA